MKKSELQRGEKTCLECKQPTRWLRLTQFAGNHPFCSKHAKLEKNFGKDDSYVCWVEVED